MSGDDRIEVLWIGGSPPLLLQQELRVRGGLRLIPIHENQLADRVTVARAVVIEFNNDLPLFIARSRRGTQFSLQHGCFVGLVRNPMASALEYDQAATIVIRSVGNFYGPEARAERPIDVFHADWPLLAQRIYDWRPGPSENARLKLTANDLTPDRLLLLRRAFSDFQRLQLKKLSGGLSGAVVYMVVPRLAGGPAAPAPLPYLAKFDDPGRIAAEHDRYNKLVQRTIAFNHRPNIIADRTVYGPTSAVLVEDFMDRALPLQAMMSRSNPSTLIASVFDGALRNWRRYPTIKEERLSDHVLFAKILNPKPEAMACLTTASAMAKAIWKSALSATDLISKLKSLPSIKCHWSTVHGDLHMGNIFVGAGSSDVILIDFYRCESGPIVIDPACFEVDILFRRTEKMKEPFVLRLYKDPLNILLPRTCAEGQEWIWDAIKSVRAFGATVDSDAYTYALSVFLLSFASYADNKTERRRALAFHVASMLATRLG